MQKASIIRDETLLIQLFRHNTTTLRHNTGPVWKHLFNNTKINVHWLYFNILNAIIRVINVIEYFFYLFTINLLNERCQVVFF